MFIELRRVFGGLTLLCGCLLVILLGCSRPLDRVEDSARSRTENGMEQTESWLSLTAHSAAVEKARKAASKANKAQFEEVFESVADWGYIDSETVELLEENRVESVARLTEILRKDRLADESVGATLLLCRLREAAGREHAAMILQKGTTDQRLQLLRGIDGVVYSESEKLKYRDFLFSGPPLGSLLLGQLDDPDEQVVIDAIQCCGYLSVPGVNERFMNLLQNKQAPDKDRLLYWLSQGELTPALFDYAVEASRKIESGNHWAPTIFVKFVTSAEEPLKTRAKDQLREILTGWPDDGRLGFNGSRLDILSALSESADESDLDWLREFVDSESGLYASAPLAAYVRLDPKHGRELLIQWLHNDEKRRAAIDAVYKCYRETGDGEIVKVLTELTLNADDRELDSLCGALSAVGGEAANNAIEKVAHKLDPASLSYYRQVRSKHSLAEILKVVLSSELLTEAEAQAAMEQLQAGDEESDPSLFGLLFAANSAIAFDVESGLIPCGHDSLVIDFAKASRGRFQPESVLEIWHRTNSEDFEAPYTLQFIVDDTLFAAEIRNFGDWYDVERIVQMINAALAHQKIDERFLGLAADGQSAMFVFAHPERIIEVAERFNLALSDDLESAMRQGIEFEQKVLQKLNESED